VRIVLVECNIKPFRPSEYKKRRILSRTNVLDWDKLLPIRLEIQEGFLMLRASVDINRKTSNL
jgi:hypothetical protein